MPTEILFTEQQRFRQFWLWALLIASNAIFGFGLGWQVYFGQTFGNKPMTNNQLILTTLILLSFSLLFVILRLDTQLKTDGIYYRFYPVQLNYKKILWSDLSQIYVRHYKPIAEYGGWGLRYGFWGSGKAFNVAGNIGLQLVYHTNKRFLIGTQKSDELQQVLRTLGRLSAENQN